MGDWIVNQRKDFLHKQSRQIANVYDCVCIENLNMQAMSQSLNFGKSVSDNGWGMFTAFLKYKLEELGKRLVKIDKFLQVHKFAMYADIKIPIQKICLSENGFALAVKRIITEI